jgi:hypothetical protein
MRDGMTMTTTGTFVEVTRRNQEAFMHLWTEGMKRWLGFLPVTDGKAPGMPSADEVVDNAFDFAEKVLASQREFTKRMLAVSRSVVSNTEWLAQDVSKDATNATKEATSESS